MSQCSNDHSMSSRKYIHLLKCPLHVLVCKKKEMTVKPFKDKSIELNVNVFHYRKIIQLRESSKKMRGYNWSRDAPYQRTTFNLAKYHSFTDIINYLNSLAVTYPDRAQIFPIGTTHEGRQIALIKVYNHKIM